MPSGESAEGDGVREGISLTEESPILVVSNRLPVTVQRGPRGLERRISSGGLVSALEPVLRRRGGTWIGWPGGELRPSERLPGPELPYRIHPVRLSEREASRYYHGFSNRTLWPLFHSLPERARFERREWEAYERVNVRFAERSAEVCTATQLVWIHDYHLMRAPRHLRRLVSDARVAFFLHIPFPAYDIFRLLPWDREILRGLLACDLVGFHVGGYAQNFLDCVERLLGARVDRQALLVEEGSRTVRVGAFPLGIDFELFEKRALAAPRLAQPAERMILGVDRLDYTKGIPEKIRAFERLLEIHPHYREHVSLLQVAVPSRSHVAEYRALKREIDELVGRVNGRFATATWSPIRYLYREVPPDRLAALYRDADVALITPLRDGMNLVAKEFVASQVRNPGVLVLSRLAGAAETMHGAILVNPYDADGTAAALHRALGMEEAERRSRIAALRRRERRDDVHAWVDRLLAAALGSQPEIRPPTDSDFEAWLGSFLDGYRLALFLDYDGTLTPLRRHPAEATLAEGMRRALETVAGREDTDVAIISGRSLADLRSLVGHPGIIFAGNHGLEIVGPRLAPFRHEDLAHYHDRTAALAADLAGVDAPGAWTEQKGPTLTFHYRAVAPENQARAAEQARSVITQAGFQARDAHCAVEARPPIGWDKGRAVLHILRSLFGPTWSEGVRVLYIGDDETDEDAFRLLAGLAITFRVGSADALTAASRRLPNVATVESLLGWLGRRPVRPGGCGPAARVAGPPRP